MRSAITTAMMVLAVAFFLVTSSGLSEAWAKGPAGKSGVTSRIATPPQSGVTSGITGQQVTSGNAQTGRRAGENGRKTVRAHDFLIP